MEMRELTERELSFAITLNASLLHIINVHQDVNIGAAVAVMGRVIGRMIAVTNLDAHGDTVAMVINEINSGIMEGIAKIENGNDL